MKNLEQILKACAENNGLSWKGSPKIIKAIQEAFEEFVKQSKDIYTKQEAFNLASHAFKLGLQRGTLTEEFLNKIKRNEE